MGVTFLLIPIVLGIVVIISALASFAFIFRRLKINHIIRKLLLLLIIEIAEIDDCEKKVGLENKEFCPYFLEVDRDEFELEFSGSSEPQL